MIRNVQENYNFYPSEIQSYKLDNINLHLNQILDGSSYSLNLSANNPEASTQITGNKDLILTANPYNDYV